MTAPSTPSPVTVRRATVADFAAVTRLRNQLAVESRTRRPDIYRPALLGNTEALFQTQLSEPGELLLVAEASAGVVGYSWVYMGDGTGNDAIFPRRFAYVYQLVVDPAFQRQGVGRRLLEAVEAAALRDGVEVLQLNVDATNVDARHFYDRVAMPPVSELRQRLLRTVSRIDKE